MGLAKDGYDRVEHDGNANAKNISIVKSTATIYAIVNTQAVTNANVTVEQGTTPWVTSFSGNVTVEDGGVALTVDGSGVTQPVSGTFWQTTQPTSLVGNVTIDSGVITSVTDITNAVATKGNVTIDSGVITTVTAVTDVTNPIALKGNVTIDSGTITLDTGTAAIGRVGHDVTGGGDGVKTVTTAGTDEALAGSTACKKVDIQAQTDNTGLIAVGFTGVDATEATGTGVILYAGDTYSLEIDNLSDIYIDSTEDGEGVRFVYYT